jgi:hypothetical protein
MHPEALIKAVQMLSADVTNLTSNLALTKGRLDWAHDLALALNPNTWGMPIDSADGDTVQVPMSQYQAIIRLLDALS